MTKGTWNVEFVRGPGQLEGRWVMRDPAGNMLGSDLVRAHAEARLRVIEYTTAWADWLARALSTRPTPAPFYDKCDPLRELKAIRDSKLKDIAVDRVTWLTLEGQWFGSEHNYWTVRVTFNYVGDDYFVFFHGNAQEITRVDVYDRYVALNVGFDDDEVLRWKAPHA